MSFIRNFCILFLLLISGFLYAYFRIDNTIFHQLLQQVIGFDLPKHVVYQDASRVMKFIAYNLPECLWVIAFMLSLYPVDLKLKWLNRLKPILVLLVFTILEFMQLAGWTKGTFDFKDIFAVLIAVGISFYLDKYIRISFESDEEHQRKRIYVFVRAILVYLTMFLAHQMDYL